MKIAVLAFGVVLSVAGVAHANLVANGNFATGDLTDWSGFTTPNGTTGFGFPPPGVISFDVTGSGAQNAAYFDVGELSFDMTEQGGGLIQVITTGAGTLDLSASIASYNDSTVFTNADAGTFSILLDSVVVATDSLGIIGPLGTLRASLSGDTPVGAGNHEIEILVTRAYLAAEPSQYVTNISADISGVSGVPEPAAWALMMVGFAGLGAALRSARKVVTA